MNQGKTGPKSVQKEIKKQEETEQEPKKFRTEKLEQEDH